MTEPGVGSYISCTKAFSRGRIVTEITLVNVEAKEKIYQGSVSYDPLSCPASLDRNTTDMNFVGKYISHKEIIEMLKDPIKLDQYMDNSG